jgi:hypothetical protein
MLLRWVNTIKAVATTPKTVTGRLGSNPDT